MCESITILISPRSRLVEAYALHGAGFIDGGNISVCKSLTILISPRSRLSENVQCTRLG